MARADSIQWMLSELSSREIVVFKHPYRSSIKAEFEYLTSEMLKGNSYLLQRYKGESLREQVETYLEDPDFKDESLYAMGAFAYSSKLVDSRDNIMRAWFYENARFSIQDQLSFPYLCHLFSVDASVVATSIFECPYLEFVGHR